MSALRIVAFETLPSTQDEARRRVLSGEKVDGLVLRAEQQTAGRGQRARDWQAGRGGSYQTLIVRSSFAPPAERPSWQPHAALVMGLGLAETLPRYGVRVGLKWPNDIYYRGKKLAGVLAEVVAGHLLIGVGLNVNNEVPPGAVGLRGWDVEGANMVVLEGLQRGLTLLGDPTFELPTAYAPFDLLLGERLEFAAAGGGEGGYVGRGAGVDRQGRLLVAGEPTSPANGATETRAFSSGRLLRFGLRPEVPRFVTETVPTV